MGHIAPTAPTLSHDRTADVRMQKALRAVGTSAVESNTWQKLANPTAGWGKTAFPKKPADREWLGVRFNYNGEITIGNTEYHKY
ncbi:hypothetical protein DFH07DRAFT_951819 [Mycena maculata]|uniref:Uncharacterized protein n=1 Tax=Mycena maculata TaxID=230809 RepID=A0AAD7NUP2_9AGAR|nr:hypothetical protein DFH07DRAFT_951819 [Mycena maculata]